MAWEEWAVWAEVECSKLRSHPSSRLLMDDCTQPPILSGIWRHHNYVQARRKLVGQATPHSTCLSHVLTKGLQKRLRPCVS